MRICRFIADTLKIPIVYDRWSANNAVMMGPYDVIFLKAGVLKFSSHREEALRLCQEAKMLIVVGNDYAFKPDPRFVKMGKPMYYWTTVRDDAVGKLGREINWNVLTWDYGMKTTRQVEADIIVPGIFYWGACRPGRMDEFNTFFLDAPYEVSIGTNPVNRHKFAAALPAVPTLNLRPPQSFVLKQHEATLYLEDVHSRTAFCQLSNRFYEAMEAGTLMLISSRSAANFVRAGFDQDEVRPFVVRTPADIVKALKNDRHLRALQYEWHVDYVTPVAATLRDAYSDLKRSFQTGSALVG